MVGEYVGVNPNILYARFYLLLAVFGDTPTQNAAVSQNDVLFELTLACSVSWSHASLILLNTRWPDLDWSCDMYMVWSRVVIGYFIYTICPRFLWRADGSWFDWLSSNDLSVLSSFLRFIRCAFPVRTLAHLHVCQDFLLLPSVEGGETRKQEKRVPRPPRLILTWPYLSFLFHRASGTNVAAIDNKIEQAMVSNPFTIDRTLFCVKICLTLI